ncbi:antitoxin Xre/MbcA/ParS toxin-binding domain-containing protein [Sphingosinicella sp. YJ22]|uniref:antitoxin Xre/MbcA/ParS toxin-binding domain-containing protein n=1 Tax=Sphingosinicella sp. YJ22 TaxID=1104780 RepID=UPI00140DA190|nr:antitoxin Xre/MbcA/ParS toxin-binding domain-containing protein [Sphingosinicella sp. YJ22]
MLKTEEELLGRLRAWAARQQSPPTLFDVISTGDGELVAAFVLERFREAAKEAVLERIEYESHATFGCDEARAKAAIWRVYDRLSQAWRLTEDEQLHLLGLQTGDTLQNLKELPLQSLPTEIVGRVATLLDIFKAINILFPKAAAADAWIRKPNHSAHFAGKSALELMTRDLDGLQAVRSFLHTQAPYAD